MDFRGIIVFSDGMMKTIGKLINTFTGNDVLFLSDQLFVIQSIGFTLKCSTIWIYFRCKNDFFFKPAKELQVLSTMMFVPVFLAMATWKIPFFAIQV